MESRSTVAESKKIEAGSKIEIKIIDMTNEGNGIGKVDGLAFFVEGAVFGDTVLAEVTKTKKHYAFAKTLEVIKKSPDRVVDECPYGKECGGCVLRELDYQAQLKLKQNQVKDKLERIGGFTDFKMNDIVRSPRIEHYRNKTTFAFGYDKSSKRITVGFHKRGSGSVIDCEKCLIQPASATAIAGAVRDFANKNKLRVFDKRSGKGLLKNLTVKIAEGTGEVMVVLSMNGKEYSQYGFPKREDFVYMIDDAINDAAINDASVSEEEPFLQSVVFEIEAKKSKYEVIAGANTITDIVFLSDGSEKRELDFEISAPAFYQTNTEQMINLYEKAIDYASLSGKETVFDLYCGIGTIGLAVASKADMIVGIESNKQAAVDANRNAVINNIVNARFYSGKAEEILPKLFDKEDKLFANYLDASGDRVAIVDPPRAGCDETLLETIEGAGIDRIVYISCDPGTLARDVKKLGDLGYSLEEVTPFDMFPMTVHVETVVVMSRKDK